MSSSSHDTPSATNRDGRDELFPSGAVLVVGGSGGVGRAVCLEFARAGTDVALTYHHRREVALEVAEGIRALGRKASVHQLTLGDSHQVALAVNEAAAAHERLHTIVIGAGTLATQVLLSEMSSEQWQTIVNQDLNGCFNLLSLTLPMLKRWAAGPTFTSVPPAICDGPNATACRLRPRRRSKHS